MTGETRQKKSSRSWKRSSISVGLIGAGRVGSGLVFQLKKKGYRIAGILDIRRATARHRYRLLKQKFEPVTLRELARRANLIFIATPDRVIAKVYRQLFPCLKPDTCIAHLSGALPSDIFKPKKGVLRLSLHPIQTFPELKTALTALPGSYFSLEGDTAAIKLGKKIVRDLGGKAVIIPKKLKPLYHTMCVIAANFLVVLLNRAETIGRKLRLKNSLQVLMPMIKQTIANVEKSGTAKSLSGPVERGEVEVVRAHLKALKKNAPELLDFYSVLSRHTIALALKKRSGAIHHAQLKNLNRLLQNSTTKPTRRMSDTKSTKKFKKIIFPYPISL